MVTILPPERTSFDALMKQLGQGIQGAIPTVQKNSEIQRGLGSIDQLQSALKGNNGEPINQADILANLAKVQALNPGFERSAFSDYVMKHAGAEAMRNAPRAGEENQPQMQRDRSDIPEMSQRKPLPDYALGRSEKNSDQFFPTNKELEGGLGRIPQQATSGVKLPLLNPKEQLKEARQLNETQRSSGLNVSLEDSLNQVKAFELEKKDHNQKVDEELKQQTLAEKEYGARGTEYLKKYYSNPSPELEAVFQQKGQDAAKRGDSEAQINRSLAETAKNLGNAMKNITDSPTATRSYNKIYRALNGTYRDFEESAEDLRRHMQPLLDEGLYDLARKEVTNLGYYPEERDIVVNPLSMEAESSFNALPKIGNHKAGSWNLRPSVDIQPLKEAIKNAKKSQDNFSLTLGRKIAEDKGYTWSDYKNALNDLEKEEDFNFSDDQKNHRGELDSPPMSFLSSFLTDIGFTGR